LCGADVSSLTELVDSTGDALFQRIYTIPTTFYTILTRSQRNRTLS